MLSATDFWFLCAHNTLVRNDDALCGGPEDPWQCARCMLSKAKAYRWPRRVLPERAVSTLLQTVSRYPLLTRQRGLRGMLGDWEDRFAFLSRALQKVDRIITASHFLRTLFIKHGVSPERVGFSTYGLDTSWAKGYEMKTASSQLRVGFIGQIVPFKGPDILLKALASLKLNVPVQLKIYGDLAKTPDYAQKLRELAAPDPRIAFLGTFDNSLMGQVLSEIDVLAVPSTWYDFPLVIPSAFATKTPVLATNLPGMNELVKHDVNGLLFERYDWMGLAQQIERLVDEPDLLERLRAGIAPVKTLRQLTEEYLTVYTSLLIGKPSLAMGEARLQSGHTSEPVVG